MAITLRAAATTTEKLADDPNPLARGISEVTLTSKLDARRC